MRLINNFRIIKAVILILLITGVTNCKKELQFRDAILITGTETNNLVSFTVEQAGSSIAVTATSTEIAKEDIEVDFAIDTALLNAYNKSRNSNFSKTPDNSVMLSSNQATIKAGSSVSTPVTVTVTSLADFIDGKPYMIPVTITAVKGYLGVLESSRTIFLRVARVITTSAPDLTNGPYFETYLDQAPINSPIENLTAFTWEVRVNIHTFPTTGSVKISRLSVFDGPSSFNLLRWGESSDDPSQLQWINTSGAVSTPLHFENDKWYLVSCVYDGSQCRLYVDGKLEGSFPAAGQIYSATRVQFGYADIPNISQNDQRFRGMTSEWRIWNRALSVEEIKNGLCAVDPASPGLEAYWKLNEGSGRNFTDYSGHGRHMMAPASPAVSWIPNQKCAN